jgi:competence ComEA-like helix-hairpin-helix protein
MSRSNRDKTIELRQKQQSLLQNDARVEVLLFLGIVFWCWLLAIFCQGRLFFPSSPENPVQLSWNGKGLCMAQERAGELANRECSADSNGDENSNFLPPAVTPFLFLPIPINFADAELLATISGIGPKLAGQIIKTRENKGPFSKPDDLLTVPGIGPSRMKMFSPQFSFAIVQ